jgi:hypothetical protein
MRRRFHEVGSSRTSDTLCLVASTLNVVAGNLPSGKCMVHEQSFTPQPDVNDQLISSLRLQFVCNAAINWRKFELSRYDADDLMNGSLSEEFRFAVRRCEA